MKKPYKQDNIAIWTWSVSFCILCLYESSNSNIFPIFQWYHFFFNLIWQSSLSLNGHMNEQHGKKYYEVLVPPRNYILLTWVPSKRHLVYMVVSDERLKNYFSPEIRENIRDWRYFKEQNNHATRCCLPNLSARLNFFSSLSWIFHARPLDHLAVMVWIMIIVSCLFTWKADISITQHFWFIATHFLVASVSWFLACALPSACLWLATHGVLLNTNRQSTDTRMAIRTGAIFSIIHNLFFTFALRNFRIGTLPVESELKISITLVPAVTVIGIYVTLHRERNCDWADWYAPLYHLTVIAYCLQYCSGIGIICALLQSWIVASVVHGFW